MEKPDSMTDRAFEILMNLREGTKKLAADVEVGGNWMEAENAKEAMEELDASTNRALANTFSCDEEDADQVITSLYAMYGRHEGAALIAGIAMGIEFARTDPGEENRWSNDPRETA